MGSLSASEVGVGCVLGGMVPVREAWQCFWTGGGGRSAFMERARGMCGSAQLPCFVIAVHCAVCLGNIKLPVLCVCVCVHVQDLPWTRRAPDARPSMSEPT